MTRVFDVARSSSAPQPAGLVACRWLAFLVPLAVGLARFQGDANWEYDLHVVRTLGLVQVGAEGVISAALSAGLALLPIGGKLFRIGLLGPVVLALSSLLVFHLSLGIGRTPSARQTVLALGAAFWTVLSSGWQTTLLGATGAAVGAGVVLLGLACAERATDGRQWLMQGVVMGLAVIEARSAGLLLGAVVLVRCLGGWELPTPRQVLLFASAFAVTVVIGLVPAALEPLREGRGQNLGLELELPVAMSSLSQVGPIADVGWYATALAALGAGLALRQGVGLTLVALVTLSVLFDSGCGRLVGAAAISVLAARGFEGAARFVEHAAVPFRRVSLGLLGLAHLAAGLIVSEEGRAGFGRNAVNATREWSEEAFERLPARSMLLVASPRAAWRLWAARLTSEMRPDVVVVPSALLGHGGLARQLLMIEPKLHRLIRDLAAQGHASEYALSELADARPLRVELNSEWGPKLVSHLVGDGLWFRFAPHAMGRSDRAKGIESVADAARRVHRMAKTSRGRDEATLERLHDDLLQHAVVCASLGELAVAKRVLVQLRRMRRDDPRVSTLQRWVRERPRGFAELDAVLRSGPEAAVR